VARQAFDPAFEVPYVLALVGLEEDPEVRLLTNLIESPIEEVKSGAAVEVVFEKRAQICLPQFRLARSAS